MLENYRIASPCMVSWESMAGDDRVRFCTHCRQQVYNFAGMSQEEAETTLAAEGQVCGRLFRRRDGTLITADCPEGLRRRTRKWIASLAALAALLLLAMLGYASTRTRADGAISRLRDIEPFRTVADWLDPAPPPLPPRMIDLCMGKMMVKE